MHSQAQFPFGLWLKWFRRVNKLTRQDLAQHLSYTKSVIADIEESHSPQSPELNEAVASKLSEVEDLSPNISRKLKDYARSSSGFPFGAWLKICRTMRPDPRHPTAGLTQDELGRKAGYSVRTIESIEQGKTHPSLECAQKLAEALGFVGADEELFINYARSRNGSSIQKTSLPPTSNTIAETGQGDASPASTAYEQPSRSAISSRARVVLFSAGVVLLV